MTNKRLALLEKMTQSGSADAFAWYGLAMEYRREGRAEQAVEAFRTLRAKFPDYLPMYLMAGQLFLERSEATEARRWLEEGVELARAKADGKALGELEEALAECD